MKMKGLFARNVFVEAFENLWEKDKVEKEPAALQLHSSHETGSLVRQVLVYNLRQRYEETQKTRHYLSDTIK